MIFKKRAHPLPSFPPEAVATYQALCAPLSSEQMAALRPTLETAWSELQEIAQTNDTMNLRMAQGVYLRCVFLLDNLSNLSLKHQRLAIGAIRYFIAENDGAADTEFATGFNDDAQVVNYVLEELGFEDQYIDIKKKTNLE